MVNESLLNYVENVKKRGFSDSQIKDEIKRAGWNDADIDEVFFIINSKEKAKKKIEPSDEFYFIPNNRVVKPSEIAKPATTISPTIEKKLPTENTDVTTKLNIIQTPSINKVESATPIHTETQSPPNTANIPITTTPEHSDNNLNSVVENNLKNTNINKNTNTVTSENTSPAKIIPDTSNAISDQELIRKVEISEKKTQIGKYIAVICTILILVFCVVYYKQIIGTILDIRSKNQDASVIYSQVKQTEIYFDYNSDYNFITGEKRRFNSFVAFKGEISIDDIQINDLAGTLEVLIYGEMTSTYRFNVSRKNGTWAFYPNEFSDTNSIFSARLASTPNTRYTIDSFGLRDYLTKFTNIERINFINIEKEIFNQINISAESKNNSLNEKTLGWASGSSVKIQTKTDMSYSKDISNLQESTQSIDFKKILDELYVDFTQNKIKNQITDIYLSTKKITGKTCESKEYLDQYRIFKTNHPEIDLECKKNVENLIIFTSSKNDANIFCVDQSKIAKILTAKPKGYECK